MSKRMEFKILNSFPLVPESAARSKADVAFLFVTSTKNKRKLVMGLFPVETAERRSLPITCWCPARRWEISPFRIRSSRDDQMSDKSPRAARPERSCKGKSKGD